LEDLGRVLVKEWLPDVITKWDLDELPYDALELRTHREKPETGRALDECRRSVGSPPGCTGERTPTSE
jgi:hypothetical protein